MRRIVIAVSAGTLRKPGAAAEFDESVGIALAHLRSLEFTLSVKCFRDTSYYNQRWTIRGISTIFAMRFALFTQSDPIRQ